MKTLLVMGACSDMGVALIAREAGNYDRVIAQHYRTDSALNALKDTLGDKLVMVWVDLTDEEATMAFANSLVENGMVPDHIVHLPMPPTTTGNFTRIPWAQFKAGLDISLRSAVVVLQKVLPKMVKNKGGKVVFMLTVCTHNLPPKHLADYVTVKYAMLGLMRALAVEYENKHIQVNAVSPHYVNTQFLQTGFGTMTSAIGTDLPMGKLLSVDDVVNVLDFLLSDGCGSLSGQNIAITLPGAF